MFYTCACILTGLPFVSLQLVAETSWDFCLFVSVFVLAFMFTPGGLYVLSFTKISKHTHNKHCLLQFRNVIILSALLEFMLPDGKSTTVI